VGADHVANCGFLWWQKAFQIRVQGLIPVVVYKEEREKRGVHIGEKEDAQHLEVIEGRYGWRTGPLEE